MATLYFNNAVDGEWSELGNWWTNDTFTTQASSLPTSSDSVVLSAACNSNSGSEPTVVNFTMNNAAFNIPITVTGNATFNDAYLGLACVVNGDVTLNGSSECIGDIYGTVVLNDYASTDADWSQWPPKVGRVYGDVQANDYAIVYGSFYSGTFRDNSLMAYAVSDYTVTPPQSADMRDNSIVHLGYPVATQFSFSGNSFNRTSLDNYTRTPPQRGINGSSILGVL